MRNRTMAGVLATVLTGLALLCVPMDGVARNSKHRAETLSPDYVGLFNYKRCLFGASSTLAIWVVAVDSATGTVEVNGVDMGSLTGPFTWNWGDASSTTGWFPQSHTYQDAAKNYRISVISHYTGGMEDTACATVRFVPAAYLADSTYSEVRVAVPAVMPTLGTRLYPIFPNLSPFGESFFHTISRNSLESILTLAAALEMDLTNGDVYQYQSKFEQVLLRDSTFGGAFSIWFSDPVAFGAGDAFLQGTIGYSSLFHEMGHNFSLNSPRNFYYGGRIDGPANAIYSETMAQIYQHAAGWVMLNSATLNNLPTDLSAEIRESVNGSMWVVRDSYDAYVNSGKPFSSWNEPPSDATFWTFMTIAYKFFEHAENSGMGYRAPLKRMMHLLQLFDQGLMDKFDQNNGTAAADSARATLLIAAMSYAFQSDLRSEFEDLNFPIDDGLYSSLSASAGELNTVPVLSRLIADAYIIGCAQDFTLNIADSAVFWDPDGDPLSYEATSSNPGTAGASIDGALLRVTPVFDGTAKIIVTASDPGGGTESTAFTVSIEACGCICQHQGDIDPRPEGDGFLDVFDVIEVINITFSGAPDIQDPLCPNTRADVDGDGFADVFDVIYLIATAFSGGSNPVDPCGL